MKELVEYLVGQLVTQPNDASVSRVEKPDGTVTYEIRVAEEDFGKIVGKGGSIANAVRTVVRAAAAKKGEHAFVDIV